MEDMEGMAGAELVELLMSRLEGTRLEDVYLDQDEDGNFLGLMFSDGETEYHLTVDDAGTVQLSEGPLEGESLQEVVTFDLSEVEAPFSEDSSS
jgi:hypothetical protein